MNVDTMRRIDRLAGVPLCAVATLVVRLRDWLSSPAARGRCGGFCSSNCPKWARRCLPSRRCARRASALSAELFFVIFERNVGSLELFGTLSAGECLHHFRPLDVCAGARHARLSAAGRRRKQIDTVVDLELFSRFTALLSGLVAAPTGASAFIAFTTRDFIAAKC